jgi:dTDP-glucose 4,6-dehydratase
MMTSASLADLAGPVPADIEAAAARVGPQARAALRGARLLVTGGTGFLGSWLVDVLLAVDRAAALDIRVTLLTRNRTALGLRRPDWLAMPAIEVVEGDVRDFRCDGERFSHVLHAATDTSAAAGRRPLELAESIVEGSRNLLGIAARSGARRYLYFSSGAVLGRPAGAGQLIGEDVDTAPAVDDPGAAYGNAKRYAEHLHLLAAAGSGMELVIARGFAFVGPRMPLDGHFAIGNFIANGIAGQSPRLLSAGTAVRSYLYAGDAAAWLLTMLALGRSGRIYNLGSDQGLTVRELAERVAAVLGLPGPVLGQGDAGGRTAYVPDIGRAREELGLGVWCPLDAAISRTADWARAVACLPRS